MSTTEFTKVAVPARIADLAFTFDQPKDFMVVPLPEEKVDFATPEYCVPLYVCMAGYGAVVFAAAARPAFEDGSLLDWAQFLMQKQGIALQSFLPVTIGGLPAMQYEATQSSEAGEMRVRAIALEDGGRLVLVSTMAPQQIWPSVEAMFDHMIASFRLDRPKGTRTPLIPGGPVPRSDLPPSQPAPPAEAAPAPAAAAPEAAAPQPAEPPASESGTPVNEALDPDHPVNANLRDRGVGLVPRVLAQDDAGRTAVVGVGAIECTFRVPFGWHVIDDGKRTLVFDAAGAIQVNLSLRPWQADADALLDALLAQNLAEQPKLQHMKLDLGPDRCLALRNYVANGEPLEQAFLVRPSHRPGMMLVTRVTATPSEMVRAMNLAEVVMSELACPASAG